MTERLSPLTQYICDKCHNVISKSDQDGWFEWRQDEQGLAYDFKIVHRDERCHFHGHKSDVADNHLEHFIGPDGLPLLMSILLPDCEADGSERPYGQRGMVRDIREFMEIYRRMNLPGYEQARLYFDEAREAELIDAVDAWLPAALERVLTRFVD